MGSKVGTLDCSAWHGGRARALLNHSGKWLLVSSSWAWRSSSSDGLSTCRDVERSVL